MPALSNPLTPVRTVNAYKPGQGSGFQPQQNGGNQYAGKVAPQGGNKPLNSLPTGGSGQAPQSGFSLNGLFQDVFEAQPNQTLPYVPPPTAGMIQDMLSMHGQYGASALPLLDMLLSEMANRSGVAEQFFSPEMGLRQGNLDQIASQDNSFLEQLLQMQQQIPRPKSGAYFYEGF